MQFDQISHQARANGMVKTGGHGSRINVDELVDLLVASSNPTRHAAVKMNARSLLERMARQPWMIVEGPHIGGIGGKGRPPDKTMHITVRVGNTYHVRLDQRGHVFEITGPGMAAIMPWMSPGSLPGPRSSG